MMPFKQVAGGFPNDPMVQCPNHWAHHILKSRMSRHLLSCDKQFPLAAQARRLETYVRDLEKEIETDRERLQILKDQIAADEVRLAHEREELLKLRVEMLIDNRSALPPSSFAQIGKAVVPDARQQRGIPPPPRAIPIPGMPPLVRAPLAPSSQYVPPPTSRPPRGQWEEESWD